LDNHPLAIRAVEEKIKKKRIANIKTILSAQETGLPDESVDIILLFDVFQMINDKEKLLEELHRVLKRAQAPLPRAQTAFPCSRWLNQIPKLPLLPFLSLLLFLCRDVLWQLGA